MRRREFITFLGGATVAWPPVAGAQQKGRTPQVGYLSPVPLPFDDEFRRGLRDLGYVEGSTVSIVARFGGGIDENLPG